MGDVATDAAGAQRADGGLLLLGAHASRRCPRRVHNDHDRTVPKVPWEPAEEVQLRLDSGIAFEAEVLDRLDFIRRGQAAGLTLAQIGQVLDIRDRGQAPCRHVTDLLDTRLDVIDRQLAELAQLRTTIADLREDAAAGDPATCSPEDVCRYL